MGTEVSSTRLARLARAAAPAPHTCATDRSRAGAIARAYVDTRATKSHSTHVLRVTLRCRRHDGRAPKNKRCDRRWRRRREKTNRQLQVTARARERVHGPRFAAACVRERARAAAPARRARQTPNNERLPLWNRCQCELALSASCLTLKSASSSAQE